jgi:hypothetical protein
MATVAENIAGIRGVVARLAKEIGLLDGERGLFHRFGIANIRELRAECDRRLAAIDAAITEAAAASSNTHTTLPLPQPPPPPPPSQSSAASVSQTAAAARLANDALLKKLELACEVAQQ